MAKRRSSQPDQISREISTTRMPSLAVDLAGERHHPDQLGRLVPVDAGAAGDHGHGLLLADPGLHAPDLLGLELAGVGQDLDDLLADPVEAGRPA